MINRPVFIVPIFFLLNAGLSLLYLDLVEILIWNSASIIFAWNAIKKYSYKIELEEFIFFLFIGNMMIGAKSFAYVGKSPLFITDICVGLIGGIILIKLLISQKLMVWKMAVPLLIVFFLLFGYAIRVLILNIDYKLDAFRDSVIIFYSVWAIFTIYMLRKPHVWAILRSLLIAAAIYCAAKYLYKIGGFVVLGRINAFEGLRFGVGYIVPSIFIFFSLSFCKKIKPSHYFLLLILILSNITLFHRSIYLGMIAGFAILFILLKGRLKNRVIKIAGVGMMGSILLAGTVYVSLGVESNFLKAYLYNKFTGKGGNVSYRTKSWIMAWDKFKQEPVLGYGVGKPLMFTKGNEFFPSSNLTYFEIKSAGGNAQIHNSPLSILTRYGIFGFTIFIGIFLYIWINLFYKAYKANDFSNQLTSFSVACTIYLFIYSCFNVVLEGPHDGSIFWIVLGVAVSAIIYNNKQLWSELKFDHE